MVKGIQTCTNLGPFKKKRNDFVFLIFEPMCLYKYRHLVFIRQLNIEIGHAYRYALSSRSKYCFF